MPPIAVKIVDLARALDIPADRIRALIDHGYLCTVKNGRRKRNDSIIDTELVLKSNPPSSIPQPIVDRQNVMLWLMGLDDPRGYPRFNKHMEMEIHRIAKLPDPVRTEQALRLLLRYRDAESIVTAIAKMRAEDVAAVEIKRLSGNYKRKLAYMAGIESRATQTQQAPAPVQAHPDSPFPSLQPTRGAERSGSSRILHP